MFAIDIKFGPLADRPNSDRSVMNINNNRNKNNIDSEVWEQ